MKAIDMNMTVNTVLVDGQFDPSFGEAGTVRLDKVDPNGVLLNPETCITDPMGRIYIAGSLGDGPNYNNYFCLRLTSEGIVDTAFGIAGYASGSFYNGGNHDKNLAATKIDILADGKILLTAALYNPPTLRGLVRLNLDGSLDLGFGEEGKVVIDFTDNDSTNAPSPRSSQDQQHSGTLALPDGKIMLWKDIWSREEIYTVVARLHENGAIDTGFNRTGFVKIPGIAGFKETYVQSILLENDGTYTVSGFCHTVHDQMVSMVTRLLPDGKTDLSFADNGYLIISSQDYRLSTAGAIRQTNNRLLAFGGATQHPESSGLLISREVDGSENIQFNRGLPLITHLADRRLAWRGALIQSDGKILVHGYSVAEHHVTTTVVARFTDAGELDPDFGAGTGGLMFELRSSSLAWLKDNKVLILGFEPDGIVIRHFIARGLLG
ncbi:hypothetical protein C1893_25760 [Pseudomonas sp. MPR-ANC1]|nr:hypothetical protein C1893_25760 [Pseudomonas sp. MPR-ANC1]